MKLLWRCPGTALVLGALSSLVIPGGAQAVPFQQGGAPGADSARLVAQAHRDQMGFERGRLLLVPLAPAGSDGSDGSCDVRIGRFCFWYRNDSRPPPEPATVTLLRDRLLTQLDSIALRVPGDAWILGQRVWYRAEAGRWVDALAVARQCGGAEPWWCAALQGLALHGMGRFRAAGRAFARALTLMDSTRERSWRIPRQSLDPAARKSLEGAPPDSLAPRLARLWRLADPLYLVPGNDRETAYYARRTVGRIRRDAVNAYQIPWGSDLEELLLRYGWEVGWERVMPNDVLGGLPKAEGYEAEQGRTFMPSGRVLAHPARARPRELEADLDRPRSLYTPEYAPVLLPMKPQIALFPRGDSFTVVATTSLPRDTTRFKGGPVPNPMHEASILATEPDQAGLFLVPVSGGAVRSATHLGSTSGTFMVTARAGRYVLSVESWSPRRRRAGRYREGLVRNPVPADVPQLSDLLLMKPEGKEPRTLEAALPYVLRVPVVTEGDSIAVGWELTSTGPGHVLVTYRLTVTRTDESVLDRARRWLHLGSRRKPLSLSWQEPASPRSGSSRFHWLALRLPELAPGVYDVRLAAQLPGRSLLVSIRSFRVRAGQGRPRDEDAGHR